MAQVRVICSEAICNMLTRLVRHGCVSPAFCRNIVNFNTSPGLNSLGSLWQRQQVLQSVYQWQVCHYTKRSKDIGGKDQSKKGRSHEKPSVQLSPKEINQVINFDKMLQQMQATVDYMKKEFSEQLTLRTSASAFNTLSVETPDGHFALIEVAQVVQKNPQLVLINMAATPQYIVHVKTAITKSGLNVNIQQDGTSLFVPIPRITREHREMLAKNAKTLCDKTKEKLRNIQNNYARDLKKAKGLYSEDLIFNLNETVLGTTKEYSEKAEKLMATKQQELMKN